MSIQQIVKLFYSINKQITLVNKLIIINFLASLNNSIACLSANMQRKEVSKNEVGVVKVTLWQWS